MEITDVTAMVLRLPGVTHATTEGSLRLYCDDGFAVLKEVVAVLDRNEVKASVSMVEPSLEDAFSVFVRNEEEADQDG